jgi:hypothetical protein
LGTDATDGVVCHYVSRRSFRFVGPFLVILDDRFIGMRERA